MSTSSKYSSNKLKQVIGNRTEHFIMKCYITAAFDFDRKKSEYYIYWFNRNAGVDPDFMKYKNMSNKKMSRTEVSFFKSIESSYNKVDYGEDGIIWEHKDIGFNKSLVVVSQITIDF